MIAQQRIKQDSPVTPADTTPVLVTRPLVELEDTVPVPVFGADVWNLAAAVFEAHASPLRLTFADVPTQFQRISKLSCWVMLNHETPRRLFVKKGPGQKQQLSVASIVGLHRSLKLFWTWLTLDSTRSLNTLTAADYDAYLHHVIDSLSTDFMRANAISAVQTLWTYRDLLPAEARLPIAIPWDGASPRILLGIPLELLDENATIRIPEATMQPLLGWAIRFVETFARDIQVAYNEYRILSPRSAKSRQAGRSPALRRRGSRRNLKAELTELLDWHEQVGRPLPGQRNHAGQLELHIWHLARRIDCNFGGLETYRSWLTPTIAQRALPLMDGAPLHDRITGHLDGAPWRNTLITYEEMLPLVRHLNIAALIIIAYLSGMRIGEVLNLERNCAVHDAVTDLDYVSGRCFKNIRDSEGSKVPQGVQREIPWTVIPIVTTAIAVVESLHEEQLLFPASLQKSRVTRRLRSRANTARNSQSVSKDIQAFVTWVNTYCEEHGRTDHIPPDPSGAPIGVGRFRRTLAWFIWNRPRGAVAAAIQYGHAHVRMTQGYAGSADSGFPDELAFEEFLARNAQILEDAGCLAQGEHVSGPAASLYRTRVAKGSTRFAGRAFPTKRQAQHALNSPELQIFHAQAMTCVFDRTKAQCELLQFTEDSRRTPDLDGCRATCANIARTDRDMEHVRRQLMVYQIDASDPLAPEPRRLRAAALADQTQKIIDLHELQQLPSKDMKEMAADD